MSDLTNIKESQLRATNRAIDTLATKPNKTTKDRVKWAQLSDRAYNENKELEALKRNGGKL